jgi:uncharacterized protein (DUF433 family)
VERQRLTFGCSTVTVVAEAIVVEQQKTDVRDLISRDRRVLGGLPVFAGTRVPVRTLFEFLEAGDDLDAFLADCPNVRREQALAAIQAAEQRLLSPSWGAAIGLDVRATWTAAAPPLT